MTTNPFLERRTRSQISVSDDVLKVPEYSPMKKARNIARLRSEPPEDRLIVDDSEDELLSSNRPHLSNSKRSVSPPLTDEYGKAASNETVGRQHKRMKWDLSEGETNSPVVETNHARMRSEPTLGPSQTVSYKRVATVSPSSKPNSTSDLPRSQTTPSLTGLASKTRAQSVPLFPSFSSLPLLDFRKLPVSPVRARSPSHSPDKYHGLKLYPSPRKSPTPEPSAPVQVIIDDQTASMEVDEDSIPPNPVITESAMTVPTSVPDISVLSPRSPTPPPPLADSTTLPLVTPLPGGSGLDPFLSPLTPLPETPLPLALRTEGKNNHDIKEGWMLPPERDSEAGPSLPPIPQPDFGKPQSSLNTSGVPKAVSRSQIPRPSVGPPLRLLDKPTPIADNIEKKSLKPTAHKASSSARPNAFTFLMSNATKQGEAKQLKDKGKGLSMPQKINPVIKPNDTKVMVKAETQVKRILVKDRMRRNEKPKPRAPTKFEPVIFDEDNDQEEEAGAEAKEISHTPDEEKYTASEETAPHVESMISMPLSSQEPVAMLPLSTKQPVAEADSPVVARPPSPPLTSIPSSSNSEPGSNVLVNVQETSDAEPAVGQEQAEYGEEAQSLPILAEPKRQDPVLDERTVENTEVSVEEQIRPTPPPEVALGTSTEEVVLPNGSKPTARKRAQSIVPSSTRVTRSAMRPPKPPPKPTTGRRRANTTTNVPREPLARTATKKPPSEDQILPPGSPMQTSSPIYKELRTPGSSPAKISLAKTPSKPRFSTEGSPSPTKIAKAVSMFRRPSTDDIGVKSSGSSLSTLSNALDKLRMPVPPRPSTSLGFNPDKDDDDDDDILLSERPQGSGLQGKNSMHQRSFTVGDVPSAGSSKTLAGPSAGKQRLVQKPMTNFFVKSGSTLTNPRSAKNQLLGSGKPILGGIGAKGKGKSIFGIAGSSSMSGGLFPMANKRLVQKVSKKSSLPVVVGSPVKGGMTHDIAMDDLLPTNDERSEKTGEGANGVLTDVFMAAPVNGDSEMQDISSSGNANSIHGDKEKEKDNKEKAWKKDSSRRASLALSQLSQSLSAAPAYGKRTMGPPATPRKVARSASSSYPTTSTTDDVVSEGTKTPSRPTKIPTRSSTSPDKTPHVVGTRFSVRQAAKAAANPESLSPSINSSPGGSVKASGDKKKKDTSTSAKKTEKLNILNGCVIFVDVKTDDGEEAGSLFVEMLESMGARILARVGQTCTHVIFKNGLMSTISRYRLLRDPKPLVVGIAWVVDCVEQLRRVEETPYLIDLKDMNVAGINKRRRSMLPKLISHNSMESTPTEVDSEEAGGNADTSMDGSTSSITLDDDITPLERARRRRSMIFGPT